jgi:phosphate transport system substrate-binding protein
MLTNSIRRARAGRLVVVALALVLTVALAIAAPPAGVSAGEIPSGSLVLAGCGSNAPILRLLAEGFRRQHPDVVIHVETIGSTNGIWTAAAGVFPVGLVSRPLRGSETELGLSVVPYARTALVLAAHPTVADDELSARDLLEIYRGALSSWRSGRAIVLFTREKGDASIQVLGGALPGFRQAYAEAQRTARQTVVYGEQQMHRALMSTPFALGLSDLGTLTIERLPLKALKIDGVSPTIENLASGRYPFVKTLAFVFREEKLPAEAKRFLAFVKSPEGRRIMTAKGYMPME